MPQARSRPKHTGRGYTGPIPPDLWEVLRVCWEQGLAIQSNPARELASSVALAASLGWISTVSLDGTQHLRVWNITKEGVSAYENRGAY